MTWADTTWGTTAWATDAGGPVTPVGTTVLTTRRESIVHAKIDGRSVSLVDWTADAAVNWGYRSLTGRIPESVTWAEQEAPVELWLSDEKLLWAGKLSLDPQTDRGMRSIRAEGYAQDLAAATTRMFYRVDGADDWVPNDSDPHLNDNGGIIYNSYKRIEATAAKSLRFKIEGGLDIIGGSRSGVLMWAEGVELTKLSFIPNYSTSSTEMAFQVAEALGPTGADTDQGGSHDTSAGNEGVRWDRSLTGTNDLVIIYLTVDLPDNIGKNFNTTWKWWLSGIRVYGRTTDDGFSASEVAADVGTTAGFDVSGVQSHQLAILPLDWTEGHPELLSYMAELCDWQWQALATDDGIPSLTFGPYETTWTGYQADGIRPTWENQKRYNRFKLPFTYQSGRHGSRTAEPLIDPFPGREVFVPDVEPLEDPQRDGTLAAAAAAAQVEFWASKRVAGQVQLGTVTSMIGEPSSGYKVKPGHLLDVADRTDLDPQRIVAVTYRDREDVTADINQDFNVIRLLAKLQRQQRRRRGKRG